MKEKKFYLVRIGKHSILMTGPYNNLDVIIENWVTPRNKYHLFYEEFYKTEFHISLCD